MWQRIQTVYLVLALLCTALCFGMPIAEFIPQEMAVNEPIYNYSFMVECGEEGANSFPLSAICFFYLVACCIDVVMAIFMYKDLKRQKQFCLTSVIAFILWYICYAVMAYCSDVEGEIVPSFATCLPLISAIFCGLALKGVKHDWNLLRSADRIR